ncbi:unnamed protein product [Schistosoma margrebowiei]|uniref:Uncharacterized protein n=1 Tax=Schistosoma margrebowiei TaxID=48269 RepID=A0A183MH74_9TREM|nr:unnamed protein product [Schistosoma margrebowiei]
MLRRTIEDVRFNREADIPSDHHMSVVKLKLKKHWSAGRTTSQTFNTALLRDTDKLNKFKIAVGNKFHAFHDLLSGWGTTINSNWKGHNKHHHKEWISVDTPDMIEDRRKKKSAIDTSRTRSQKSMAQYEYIELNEHVKRVIRTDERQYVEDILMTAQKVALEGHMRQS